MQNILRASTIASFDGLIASELWFEVVKNGSYVHPRTGRIQDRFDLVRYTIRQNAKRLVKRREQGIHRVLLPEVLSLSGRKREFLDKDHQEMTYSLTKKEQKDLRDVFGSGLPDFFQLAWEREIHGPMSPTFEQSVVAENESAADGLTFTITAPTSNNLLVICHGNTDGDSNSPSLSSGFSLGGTATPPNFGPSMNILYKLAAGTEGTSIVVTHTSGEADPNSGAFFELSGIETSDFTDGFNNTPDSGSGVTSRSSNSITTTEAKTLLIGAFGYSTSGSPSSFSFSNSFTQQAFIEGLAGSVDHATRVGVREVSSIGSYSTALSWSGSTRCGGVIGAFVIADVAPVVTMPSDITDAIADTQEPVSGISVADDGELTTCYVDITNGATATLTLSGTTLASGSLGSASFSLSGNKSQINAALATMKVDMANVDIVFPAWQAVCRLTVQAVDDEVLNHSAFMDITFTKKSGQLQNLVFITGPAQDIIDSIANTVIYDPASAGDGEYGFLMRSVTSNDLVDETQSDLIISTPEVNPIIIEQPGSQAVVAPNKATFHVTAIHGIGYQWYVAENIDAVPVAIPGAISATYVVNPTSLSDHGKVYSVDISNEYFTTSSTGATLSVYETITDLLGLNLKVFIDDVNKTSTIRVASVEIEQELHTRSLAKFQIISESTENDFYRPLIGEKVDVYFRNVKIWSGSIDRISERQELGLEEFVYIDVECVSWEQICDRILVAEAYEDMTMHGIITDIVTEKLSDEGITEIEVQEGPTIEKAVFNYSSVSEVFNELAAISGWSWWIDVEKGLYFVPNGTTNAPLTLNSNDQFQTLSVTKERGDYRNVQYVRAGLDVTDSRVETFKGDGENKTFTLAFPVAQITSIKVNTVAKTYGIRGVEEETTKEWYYQINDAKISQDLEDTSLSSSDTLEVTYAGFFPLLVITNNSSEITNRKNIEGGTGRYEAVEDREEINVATFAYELANGILRRKGLIPETVSFVTTELGLRAGQLLSINLPQHNLSGEYLISRVSFQEIGTLDPNFYYSVEALSGEALGGWAEFWMSLARRGRRFTVRENEVTGPLIFTEEILNITETVTAESNNSPCAVFGVSDFGMSEVCDI